MSSIEAVDVLSAPGIADTLRATFDQQRAAFLQEGPPTLEQRRIDLGNLRKAIRPNVDRIAAAISADFGHRSRHETALADVFPVLAAIRHATRNLARWMRPRRVAVGLEFMPARARVICQPLGVIGVISPWNYPFQLAMMPVVAAIAAGNRIMLKPSELTPRTSDLLAELLSAIFPEGKVAITVGGAAVGAAFARLPFDHLFYTGSTAVGRLIMQAAAENLTPVTLELGGKSPCIVGEDADLRSAVESIMFGKFHNAGQICVAPDYVLLPEARREDFIEMARSSVEKLYPTLETNPDYTSIVNERHYQRIASYIEEAKRIGVRVVEINPAHEPLGPTTRKLPPTLVVDPPEAIAMMREEIFGPVLPIKTYRSLEEALAYINHRPRPLALYYFGIDKATRDEVLRRTVSGGASINETLLHVAVDNLPFGGVGQSGMGAYHGEFGFQTFSHRKAVFLQSKVNSAGMLRPPFGRLTDLMIKFLLSR